MWKVKDNSIYRRFEFQNFAEAFAFMSAVAVQAEKMQHHPLWTNEYNIVEVWLTTHDEGHKVTDKDRQLSEIIDRIYNNQTAE